MEAEWTRQEVGRAITGEEPVVSRLVMTLTPVVQARVARALLRRSSALSRDLRQEVEDLTQEVLLSLFVDGGRVLAGWEPERGLSLRNFVGLVAERRTASILRSGRRSAWREDPTMDEQLDGEAEEAGPEQVAASREELRQLLQRLTEELSPLGRQLFDLLFLRELSVNDVIHLTGLSADAVYAWRSRLRRLCRQLLQELSETVPRSRRS